MKQQPSKADIEIAFRRAGGIRLLNSKAARFSFDQPARDSLKHRPSRGNRDLRSRFQQRVRDICQRLLGRAFQWVQRRDYFDAKEGQDCGQVVCIDGHSFRILVSRHRLYLLIDGKQHAFSLVPGWTEQELAILGDSRGRSQIA